MVLPLFPFMSTFLPAITRIISLQSPHSTIIFHYFYHFQCDSSTDFLFSFSIWDACFSLLLSGSVICFHQRLPLHHFPTELCEIPTPALPSCFASSAHSWHFALFYLICHHALPLDLTKCSFNVIMLYKHFLITMITLMPQDN